VTAKKLKFGAKTVKFISPSFGCIMFVCVLVLCLCLPPTGCFEFEIELSVGGFGTLFFSSLAQ
jgi:hypothetical protein